MSDGHLIDSYPQTSLSLRQCCKAAVQQALKCCLLFSTNRTKYSVQCSVKMQWHCLSASHVLNPMPVWSSKIEARTELFWRLKPSEIPPCSSHGFSDTVLDRRWFSRFASPLPPMLSLTVQGTVLHSLHSMLHRAGNKKQHSWSTGEPAPLPAE